MGIDIYMQWKNQKKEEKEEQCTGFSVVHGHVGYLREAYHGEPYVTRILVPEAFKEGKVQIPAKILKERLPQALIIAEERTRKIYKGTDEDVRAIQQSFADFVELAEIKEEELGEPVTIIASY